jgi:hypothetical protein
MSEASGLDLLRAWRLVGVFAPVTMLVTVPVALLSVANAQWAMWVAYAVLPASAAAVGLAVSRGERGLARLGAAVASASASAASTVLVFQGIGPLLAFEGDTVVTTVLLYAVLIGLPWALLIIGGTMAARAGRYPGAAHVTIWWILAVGIAGLAVPPSG